MNLGVVFLLLACAMDEYVAYSDGDVTVEYVPDDTAEEGESWALTAVVPDTAPSQWADRAEIECGEAVVTTLEEHMGPLRARREGEDHVLWFRGRNQPPGEVYGSCEHLEGFLYLSDDHAIWGSLDLLIVRDGAWVALRSEASHDDTPLDVEGQSAGVATLVFPVDDRDLDERVGTVTVEWDLADESVVQIQ